MALTRAEIIAEAITRSGRKGGNISLTIAFDEVTLELSDKYPFLRNAYAIGNTVDGQAYISLPVDHRGITLEEEKSWRWKEALFLADGDVTQQLTPESYEHYIYQIRTLTQIEQKPTHYSIKKDESRIYLRSTPDDSTYIYYFYFCRHHPQAGRKLSFTSGGTHELLVGDTISQGAASGLVSAIILTSGAWKDADAAGDLILSTQTGTFASGVIAEGANADVAAIAGDSATADNFTHLYGREFDEPIIYRLGAKCCFDYIDDHEKGKTLQASYERIVNERLTSKVWRGPGGCRANFHNPSWPRRNR